MAAHGRVVTGGDSTIATRLGLGRRGAHLLLAAAASTAAVRLALIWTGRAEGSLLADDAYYYFTIAHNLATGIGATFDGLAPTNGFHPLWQLMLVPLFAFFRDDPFTPIRAALTLALLLDLATAGLLARAASQAAGRGAALAAGLLWLLNPVSFLLGLRGMEASLSALMTLVLLHVTVMRPRPAWIGLTLGLAGLARTDNLVVLGAAVACTRLLRRGEPGTALASRLGWLTRAAGVALLVVAPWLLWSVARFGTVWQSSARMKWIAPDLFGALPARWGGLEPALASLAHALLAPWLVPLRFLAGEEMASPDRVWWLLAGVVGPTAVLWILGARRLRAAPPPSDRAQALGSTWVFLGSALVAHVLLFGVVGRSYGTWYAHPAWALWALGTALALGRLARTTPRWLAPRAVVAGLALLVLVGTLSASARLAATELRCVSRWPEKRFGPEFASLAQRIRQSGPGPLWVLGAFDAGVRGWMALRHPEFTVVNLDGLVNNAVPRALEEGRYVVYVRETCDSLLQKADRALALLPRSEVERLRREMSSGLRRPSARGTRPTPPPGEHERGQPGG